MLCVGCVSSARPGLFGSAPSSSNIFGASTANANGAPKSVPAFGSSFGLGLGGQQQQQQPKNAFGASTLSTSALRPPGAAQPGQGQGQQGARPRTIEGIAAAWNAAGLGYIFYDRVDHAQVGLDGRPPNATNNAAMRTAHALTAGAREPPAPARARAALVGHPRRGGGTARVAGGATGGGGPGRAVGAGRRAGGGTEGAAQSGDG
ncbi:hypothetical protein B0H14DRAFT_2694013, partial [Mycena olivaceomarginata]